MRPHDSTRPTACGFRLERGLLLVAVMTAILLVGCGGSRTHGGSHAQKPITSSAPVVYETPAVIAAAVHACKQGAHMAHWLTAGGSEQLEGLCERGRRSGLAVIAESASEVCGEVAFTSPLRDAPARARLLAECLATTKADQKTAR
jgi:hypothetical protein